MSAPAASRSARLALGLLLCGVVACSRPPPPPPPPPAVGYVTVQTVRAPLTTSLPGRTSAYEQSDVRPQVNGVIKSRLFTEGAEVRAGQVLYQIDPAPYRATEAQARASVANAEAAAATLRLKAERYRDLVKINAVSRQEDDDAEAAAKQADASVLQARAALQTASINLGYTRVVAPISGRIGRSAVTPGALAIAGQAAALATIDRLDPIYVDLSQSADEILHLRSELSSGRLGGADAAGAKVTLILADGSTYRSPGRLKFSEALVDPATGSVTLRAVFPNPDRLLLPGMFVRAELEEGVIKEAVLVPQRALSRNEKGEAAVYVVGPGDTAQLRLVKAARAVGDAWIVTSGLKAGERLIVDGLIGVRAPGQKVRPSPAAAPSAAPRPPGA